MRKKRWRKVVSLLLIMSFVVAGFPAAKAEAAGNGVREVSLGSGYSGAVKENGSLWMWGDGYFLPPFDGTDKLFPVKVLDSVRDMSLGYEHFGAIKEDGSLWMWGGNASGILGDGTTETRKHPVKILDGVREVSLGSEHSGAIKEDGSLWMWGDNRFGQLGDGTFETRLRPVKIMDGVRKLSVTYYQSGAIKEDGSLWMWGDNEYGQIGDGMGVDITSPTKIMDGVREVSLGDGHCAVIKEDGSLWMWGYNKKGQLGDGTTETRTRPVKIMDGVREVSLGVYHSGAIKEDGSLWMWGMNSFGQLGDGTYEKRTRPVKIMDGVREVSLGAYHSGAVKEDGSLWMWGDNGDGRLGDGTRDDKKSPVQIEFPDDGDTDVDVVGDKLQAPASVTVNLDETEKVKVFAFEESLDKLRDLTQLIAWESSDPKVADVNQDAKFIMPVKPKVFSSDVGSYKTWQSIGIVNVKGIKPGKATITGTASDGTSVSFQVIVNETTGENTGTAGSGGSFELGEDQKGSDDSDVAKFFPANFELKNCVFPIEVKVEEGNDGSFTMRGTVGLGKSDLLDDETEWEKFKENVEDCNKYKGEYDLLNKFKERWNVQSVTAIRVDKFKKVPELSIAGYFETTYDKYGKVISHTGKLASDCEWEGNISWQFVTPIGPLYLNLSGGGKISGEIDPMYDYEVKKLHITDGSLKLIPKVALEGGYGVDKLASIGAQGALELPVTVIPATKAELEAKASVRIKLVFFIDYTQDLATYKTTLWDTTNKKKPEERMLLEPYSAENTFSGELSLMDTSFAEKESKWNPTVEDAQIHPFALEEAATDSYAIHTLQEGVLPSTLPMQAEIDGKQVLVFQAYDQTRATVDSTVLKYSVFENGVWSEPQAVYDNGCADLFADMKVVNGKLALVWQKEKSNIIGDISTDSQAVLEEIAENSEIYCALFDAEINQFVNPIAITNNNVCDMMPKVVENGSDITISWVRNDANSLMQQTGTNQIYTCVTDGTVCDTEKLLTQAPGTIDNYIVYQEEELKTVFAGKADGVFALFDTDGNVHTAFEDLMKEEGEGTFTSLNYGNGKIRFIVDGTLYEYSKDQNKLKAYKAGESAFGSEVKYCTNGTKSGYIWSIYDEATNTGKLLASMETQAGYSEPVAICEAKDSIWRYYAPILGADGTWKVIVNTEKAAPAAVNAGSDSVQLNALQYITKTEEEKVELELGSVHEFDRQNGKTAVEYLVTNRGDKPVRQVVVELTTKEGTKVTEIVPVELQPGESKINTTYMDLSPLTEGKPGTQDVTLGVHAEGQKDTSASTVTEQIGKADVEVTSTFTETKEHVTINAQLKNNGNKDAVTTLKLFKDETKKTELQKKDGLQIAPGATKEVTFKVEKKDVVYNADNAAYLTLEAVVKGGDYKESNNTDYVMLYKNEPEVKPDPQPNPDPQPDPQPQPQMNFVDVKKGDWFYDAVAYVNEHQLMTGLNPTTFGPTENLARAQFSVILHRMNGAPSVAYDKRFPDVPKGTWFTDAVLWANENKVVTGYSHNGYFGPADNINREQMAVMMYRYAMQKGYDVSQKADFGKFKDANRVNAFAKEAMQWAVGTGIITGKYHETMLEPQGYASRAECATIMMRFLEKYPK